MQLKDYIKQTDRKANDIAKKAGVPFSCLYKFINGQTGMSARTASRVSAATNGQVAIEELLYPEGIASPAKMSQEASNA